LKGEGPKAFEESWVDCAIRISEGWRRVRNERLKVETEPNVCGSVRRE
jgi:hypothetical protein